MIVGMDCFTGIGVGTASPLRQGDEGQARCGYRGGANYRVLKAVEAIRWTFNSEGRSFCKEPGRSPLTNPEIALL
jgi:hypothetical protein